MAIYWVNFRLESDSTYQERYEELIETIRSNSLRWWTESTSFIVFESAEKIDALASVFRNAVNPRTDLVLIGMPYFKDARVVGQVKDLDLFAMIDFMKTA